MSQIIEEQLKSIQHYIAEKYPNITKGGNLDYLTFIVSLLPIPLVSQSGQIANKIINDKNLNEEFTKLKDEVLLINDRLDTVGEGLKRIEKIRATIDNNTKLRSTLFNFLESLKNSLESEPTKFDVDTKNWSSQKIINTIITVQWVTISSENFSSNVLSNIDVEAQITKLSATNNSHNIIHDSSFKGKQGSVSMTGEHIQYGDISLSEASISYGQNSQTQMGSWVIGTDEKGNFVIGARSPEPEISLQCKSCNGSFTVNRQELQGLTHFQCKLCGRVGTLPPFLL